MNLIEAAEQALEVLEQCYIIPNSKLNPLSKDKAVTNLRAAIAETKKVKPVGYVYSDAKDKLAKCAVINRSVPNGTPLFTHPSFAAPQEQKPQTTISDSADPAQPAPVGAAPEGWKLVPVEPTKEMIVVMASDIQQNGGWIGSSSYKAMIAAAPEAPK